MNPCATFSPPIMYTNEYREKKIRNDVATIYFFFSLKNKIKYSFKIRRYRNSSEFSPEKYISNDIKKRKRKGKNIDDAEEEKHFYSSKIRNASSTFKPCHDSPSILEISPSSTKYGNRYRVAIYRCSKDWIRNIGEKFEIGR